MNEDVEFDCPRCGREYQLNMNVLVARQSKRRAKCSRCGESFEIAARLDAAERARTEALEVTADDILDSIETSVREPHSFNVAVSGEMVQHQPFTEDELTKEVTAALEASQSENLQVETKAQVDQRLEPDRLDWLSLAELPIEDLAKMAPDQKPSLLVSLIHSENVSVSTNN